MKIGIIGPSKVREEEKLLKLAKIVSELNHEIVITPDKGSSSEFFAEKYLENNGKKIYEIVPLDDKEFGYSWVNLKLGEHINCQTWRNQPEKLNEETDVLLCIGCSVGALIEIGYTKWFKKKPVYIIKELAEGEKLPKVIEKSLDIRYISIKDISEELK
ncbi:hypothetical protein CMI39_02400 [Candidatus Pacearchaeota archaeon]|nr:hypothetical protein [Candidatus Pacearchaeota archaeon]